MESDLLLRKKLWILLSEVFDSMRITYNCA